MTTLELNKGEFYTIEAFTFSKQDDILYEEDRDEDLDTYWYESKAPDLLEYVTTLCQDHLKDNTRLIDVNARRWATIVDGFPEDYGDTALDCNRYVWTGKELLSESDYLAI